MLKFRHQEALQRNSTQLQQIAENEVQESKLMSEVAIWTYNDSRTTRIATVIALVYLPASLVLVSDPRLLSFFISCFCLLLKNTSSSQFCPKGRDKCLSLTYRQSFFSTIFVELGESSTEAGSRGSKEVLVSSQLWIAITSMLVLVFATFVAFWIWKLPLRRMRSSTC